MLLVMLLHVPGTKKGVIPTATDQFLADFVSAASFMCVNLFVMISGWFGIHFKLEGVSKLLFQAVFLAILTYLCLVLVGLAPFSITNIWHCTFGIFGAYWFIWAYLLLYIFAPVLNAFVDYCSEKELRWFLIFFYGFALYNYFTLKVDAIYLRGFHAFAFIGLYLLARYMHVYQPQWTKLPKKVDFLIYLFVVFVAVYADRFIGSHTPQDVALVKIGNYIKPTCMVCTVFFFLIFTKFKFQSKLVNWLAVSCFAAYLIHMQLQAKPVYNSVFAWIHNSLPDWAFWPTALLMIAIIFMVCVLVDKIRILAYNGLKYLKVSRH